MRQHVNPLSRVHQAPRPLPPLRELFARPGLPLHLDIGSARGRFLLAMARLHPQRNHLGVEIRRPLVQAAEAERIGAELTNLCFLYNNASVNLGPWLEGLPTGLLELVTIQFPDPWFKKKHQKRRVLQAALLRGITAALAPGGTLFLQSDVPAVLAAMVELVEACGGFERLEPRPATGENPLPVATERETFVLSRGLPVYRATYHRNAHPLANYRAAPGSLDGGGWRADNPGGAGASPAPVPPV